MRVDHPDGLWNPEQYLARLQNTFRKNRYKTDSASLPLYVVAEKILTKDELLPEGWPVDGTTGYDFLNRVNGIFIDSTNADAFADIYQTFTHCAGEFSELVHSCKKRILDEFMASELTALTHRLKSAALSSRYGQDFTFKLLHEALGEIIAAYPVYRSYATETSIKPTAIEARHTEEAISAAKQRNSKTDQAAFDFIRSLLLLQLPADLDEAGRRHCREFVLKFQQLTGPVMAKGLEDTVFYIYNRFVSLNEVGGSPEEFGTSLAQFHQHNLRMAGRWPHSMLATSTHDTKRGEDVRARLNVISEMPIEWRAAVERWTSSNSKYKTEVAGAPAPYKNDEYLLYQTLLGAWPFDADRSGMFDDFKKRLLAYMFKAIREAKTNTTWNDPNQAYEEAVKTFIVEILDLNTPFMTDFREFQSKVAYFGIFNSLSQTVLKLTAPGVPDTYQGAELWDFSMVDPDNRRPVGFSLRQEMLINLRNASGKGGSTHGSQFEKLLGETHTGAVKMFTVHRALEFRRQHRVHFEKGDYVALSAAGKMKNHVCAFARCHGSKTTITIVPRLVVSLTNGRQMAPTGKEVWADTWLALPFSKAGDKFCNAFTHETHTVQSQNNEPGIFLSDALAYFPVALLEKVD
ncbi:malto-oligosyltrehalose synthase [Pedosphaera parvula]|uniref:malto-oligosyltrehalose synthase n=1 Tax=Pedosphaera parvula TaxID=1032527 RepID=UPI000A02F419|nr:malto-oligosyltrehalose synthase [Pedosphaera parvula]